MQFVLNTLKACLELPFALGMGSAWPVANVNFTLCYRCNLNCRHCRQRIEYKKMSNCGRQEMSAAEIAGVVRQTIPGLTRIGFCGGETFLHPEIMEILAETVKRNPVGLVTNGTRIDSERARELVGLGVRTILFSLDDTEAGHDSIRGVPGTFSKALKSIELLDQWKRALGRPHPEISVNAVVMGENANSLHQLVSVLAPLGVRSFEVQMIDMQDFRFTAMDNMAGVYQPTTLPPSGPENLGEILADLFRYGPEKGIAVRLKPISDPFAFEAYYKNQMDLSGYFCNFPWKNLIVSPYGDVYPCYMLPMGNVREQSLGQIWNGKSYKEFRKSLLKAKLFPGCRGCCFMSRKTPA